MYVPSDSAVYRFGINWVALLVSRYLSNAASFVLCVLCRVKDRHALQHSSPFLKKACVRQVASDKCFPPSFAVLSSAPFRKLCLPLRGPQHIYIYISYIYIYIYICIHTNRHRLNGCLAEWVPSPPGETHLSELHNLNKS